MGTYLWSAPPTPREMMQHARSTIRKSVRELDREIERMGREEAKLIEEIRVTAAKGNMGLARTMTKELVRQRNAVAKCYEMRVQLQGVRARIQHMASVAAMSEAMREATRAMYRLNRQVKLPAMQNILRQFEREGQVMEWKQEMMDDAIDDAVGEAGDAQAEDEVLDRVMDEIGIGLSHTLAAAPSPHALDSGLKQRLDGLKK